MKVETNVVVIRVDGMIKGNCDHPLAQHVTPRSVFNKCSAAAQTSRLSSHTFKICDTVGRKYHVLTRIAVCQKLMLREVNSMQDSRNGDT